jgi:hypothetical protein
MTCPLTSLHQSQRVKVSVRAQVRYIGTDVSPVPTANLILEHTWPGQADMGWWVNTWLESYNWRSHYIRHRDFFGFVTPLVSGLDKDDARFRVEPGLSDPTGVSFLSFNAIGQYLRHKDWRIKVDPNDGTWGWRLDATFLLYARVDSSGYSLVPVNSTYRLVRHNDLGELGIDPDPSPGTVDRFDADRTFFVTDPRALWDMGSEVT